MMKVSIIKDIEFEDGEYLGSWGGHVLRFTYQDQMIEVKTQKGVRTPALNIEFSVVDGEIDELSFRAVVSYAEWRSHLNRLLVSVDNVADAKELLRRIL